MSEAANVRVEIRHIQLAGDASVTDADDGAVFIALDDPPPVRSIVAVHGAGEMKALEVTGVVEVAGDEGRRGVYGRYIETDALQRYAKVGTEHLDDGQPEDEGEHEAAANAGDSGSQMAMPAPVMDPDDSEPIDLAERRQVEEDPNDTRDADPNEDEEQAESETETSADDGDEATPGPRRGKRRRGRKRK